MTGCWAVLFQLGVVSIAVALSVVSIRSWFGDRRPGLAVQAALLTLFGAFLLARFALYVQTMVWLRSLNGSAVARVWRNDVEVADPAMKEALIASLGRCRPFQRSSSLQP